MGEWQQGVVHDCGYCIHYMNFSCEDCHIKNTLGPCFEPGSAYYEWEQASYEDRGIPALKIFDVTVKHGKELGYISGVQIKKIKEIEKLRNKKPA